MIEKKQTINHDDTRKIEEYYIAYVDLLGYKDFFEKHADKVLYFLKTLEHAIANNGELSRNELIILLQRIHSLKENDIMLPCPIDYAKLDKGLEDRKIKIKNGLVKEPERYTFSEYSALESETISIYEKIEKMDELLFAWKNRALFIEFLRKETKVTKYDLNHECIDCFDEELCDLFVKKYNSSSNSERRELCWALKSIDFNNDSYSSQEDRKITIENFKLLLQKINNQIETTSDQITVGIAKVFKSHLEEKISELGRHE